MAFKIRLHRNKNKKHLNPRIIAIQKALEKIKEEEDRIAQIEKVHSTYRSGFVLNDMKPGIVLKPSGGTRGYGSRNGDRHK